MIRNSLGVSVFSNQGGGGFFEFTTIDLPNGYTLVAEGGQPLVLRATGSVDIAGVIDVSGQPGGIPDVLAMTQALGGAGGPAGGAGGDGGAADLTSATAGGDGGYPANFPPSLINPPTGGGGVPIPPSPVTVALGGEATLAVTPNCSAGRATGAGFSAAGDSLLGNPLCALSAAPGGSAFGSNLFIVPDPGVVGQTIELRTGGTGGAGGGGGTDLATVAAPGTAGGGAGGFVEIASGGAFIIRSTAEFHASGGDAYLGPAGAGVGSPGAGGAIRLRGRVAFAVENGAFFDAAAGSGNVNPISAGLAPTYIPTLQTGPLSSVGRLRFESAIGFLDEGTALGSPPPTTGAFETAGLTAFIALSRPMPVTVDGVVTAGPTTFDPAIIEPVGALAPGTVVRVLYEGARRDLASPHLPGIFTGTTDDPSLLEPFEFIRTRIVLYATPTAAPEVESAEYPYTVF